jgi:hypothetical protein
VQQAGLGGQIQAMQMQDAQKELMGRLMAQQKQAPGLMGLNPQMGNFAEGGIVGYQAGGVTGEFGDISALLSDQAENPQNIVDQIKGYFDRLAREGRQAEEAQKMQFLEQNAPGVAARVKGERAATQAPAAPAVDSGAQMQANMDAMRAAERRMTPAAAPRQAPAVTAAPAKQGIAALTGAAAMRQQALDELGKFRDQATPEQIRAQAEATANTRREFERSQGIDPEFLAKQIADAERRGKERMSYADRLAAELDERRKDEGIINFLLAHCLLVKPLRCLVLRLAKFRRCVWPTKMRRSKSVSLLKWLVALLLPEIGSRVRTTWLTPRSSTMTRLLPGQTCSRASLEMCPRKRLRRAGFPQQRKSAKRVGRLASNLLMKDCFSLMIKALPLPSSV